MLREKMKMLTTEYLSEVESRISRVERLPLPLNVGQLLDDAARHAGEREVLNFFETGETETYDTLRRRVNGLAAALVAIGIRKGTRVAVMLPNIPAMPISWLALAKVGAIMVPINTAYKARELAYVVNDSQADYIIVHQSYDAVLAEATAQYEVKIAQADRIGVGGSGQDLDWADLASEPAESFVPPEDVLPGDILNIQYTSGTTGHPKGCLLSHEYWLVSGYSNAFRDGLSYERLLASTPFFYMDPQWLLLMTMLQGGTLFVAQRQSTSRFLGWLKEYRINFCLFPWVLHKTQAGQNDADNQLVRANIYGVPSQIHGDIEQRFGLRAREAFGMTELGPTLFMPIEADDMVGSGSCGRPAPFRECRIIDENGDDVARGDTGELIVRGRGILKGYFGNEKATSEAFIGEWFRTGDLFRQDERGFFRIVGRNKDMVRRSGENIAAREVESVVNAVAEVAESAVLGVPDGLRGEEVKAAIILNGSAERSDEVLAAIIAHCEKELAAFKVPRYYAFYDAFPRTGSGKIAKHMMKAEGEDPIQGTFDRIAGKWN